MTVLIDTSIWIDHLRKSDKRLVSLLETQTISIHPFVLGELACGNIHNRKEIIALLHALPFITKVDDDELLFFIERYALMGRGIGLVDIHLLAACYLNSCLLWTKDRRLRDIAVEMGIEFTQQSNTV